MIHNIQVLETQVFEFETFLPHGKAITQNPVLGIIFWAILFILLAFCLVFMVKNFIKYKKDEQEQINNMKPKLIIKKGKL